MNQIRAFFTQQPATTRFTYYGPLHLAILAAIAIAMWYSYRPQRGKKFELFLVWAIVINQAIMYAWYACGKNLMFDGLPLYTCRIADIMLVLGFFLRKDFFKAAGIYLGFIGGVVGVIYPSFFPEPMFHYTNINFFFSHTILICLSLYYMRKDQEGWLLAQLKKVMIFTVFLLMGIAFINFLNASNYSYTVFSPIAKDFFARLPWIMHFVILVCIYELLILMQAGLIKILEVRRLKQG